MLTVVMDILRLWMLLPRTLLVLLEYCMNEFMYFFSIYIRMSNNSLRLFVRVCSGRNESEIGQPFF